MLNAPQGVFVALLILLLSPASPGKGSPCDLMCLLFLSFFLSISCCLNNLQPVLHESGTSLPACGLIKGILVLVHKEYHPCEA